MAEQVTPSGIRIEYQESPTRRYKVNGVRVPSVTEVLSVLDKPALTWWGMQIGVKGVIELINQDELGDIDSFNRPRIHESMENVVDMLTEHKLTVNHVRDKAGVRGNSAHDAFEAWAQHDIIVNPTDYPEEEQGYVHGVLKFIEDVHGSLVPRHSELMVGSSEYEYAGRYDLDADLEDIVEVIKSGTKRLTKMQLEPGYYLWDLKTTKRVYVTHHLQLSAYEGARRECGYRPTDKRAVILVKPEGTYNVQVTKNCYPQFLAVREAYRAMQVFKEK